MVGRAALAAAFVTLAAQAATPSAGAAALDRELAAIVNDPERPLASLSVLVIREGKVVYHRQFGRRHIDSVDPAKDRPADARTLYRIASITKLVTTIGALRLVEEGKLSLDGDVGEVLGFGFRNPAFPGERITLRMLLTHTSSLRDDGGYYWEASKPLKAAMNDAMWAKNAPPGRYFQYANLPWGVVGTLMERATGERFDRLMKRLVLDPMGLAGGFNPAEFPPADLAGLATLYRKAKEVDGRMAWDPKGPWIAQVDDYSRAAPVARTGPDYEIGSNGTAWGPQGNIRLSAEGLGRIMRMLMDRGEIDGRRILREETVDLMLSRQWTYDSAAGNGNPDYGIYRSAFLAWGLGNQHFLDVSGGAGAGDRLVADGGFRGRGHLGDAYGLNSVFAFDPDKRRGVVVLAGGPGFDPDSDRGQYSGRPRYEERILTALFRHEFGARPRINSGTDPELERGRTPNSPAIVSAAEWGGTPADASRARRHTINRITLHHEGVPHRADRDPVEYLSSLQKWSRQARNWIDIPYHYVIDLKGGIYEGRSIEFAGDTNTDYDPAGHALISVVGNLDEVEPNAAQLDALARLTSWLAAKYRVAPEDIRGHRDYASNTTCPGNNLYRHLERFRAIGQGDRGQTPN
jgi:CubicO group peptidase (beta-lactamase class C family)